MTTPEMVRQTPLVLHGHFYQPPRENPWTEVVYRECSADPFHDWNERIQRECYRANAFARILDEHARVKQIINNYSRISFNFGPTLLRWMEQYDAETYARIIEADRTSRGAHDGHGNAIAQGYNHAILPLCNERDRVTQVRWGVADFRRRFGRDPEALWLPETACNEDTLETLIDEGLRFAILSPHQAQRVRELKKDAEWQDVSDGSINPGMAYRYVHRDGSGRALALFFYDAHVAHAIAFERALYWSEDLLDRLTKARGAGDGLVHAATDGESFGHHTAYGDRVLAYALEVLAPRHGFRVTNYGEFLDLWPPTFEVEIKPGPGGEGTAWSCSHGVGRWQRDCGCSAGGREGWNQAWRGPLRQALDFLRDAAAARFEEMGGGYFRDPWAARDGYIEVILDRGASREAFLERHCRRHFPSAEQVRGLILLEMQRSALLMYTSCGWFFADISGIETVQVLKYAGRVLDRMEELDLDAPRERFLEILAEAKSNLPAMGTGADVYRRFVDPARVSSTRMVANLALTSLVDSGEGAGEAGCFVYQRKTYAKEQYGRLTLATGRIILEETSTGRLLDCAVAALHFGGIDFYCVARPFADLRRFHEATQFLWEHFRTAPLAKILVLARETFGPDEFGLEHILPDGLELVSGIVFGELLDHFSQQYARLYDDNRRLLDMLQSAGFRLPPELRAAADFTLSHRFEKEIRGQLGQRDPAAYKHALELAEQVAVRGYQIDRARASHLFGETITDAVRAALEGDGKDDLAVARSLIELAPELGLNPDLGRAQDAVYAALHGRARPSAELVALAEALRISPEVGVRHAEKKVTGAA